jgi:hypothetical protein
MADRSQRASADYDYSKTDKRGMLFETDDGKTMVYIEPEARD